MEAMLTSESLAGMEDGGCSAVLAEARRRYGENVSDGDLWHYIYATFHAPDWRNRFANELENSPPRFPWVTPRFFETFRDAGAELMGLHADFRLAPMHPGPLPVIESGGDLLIPPGGMSWAKTDSGDKDFTVIQINPSAAFTRIPPAAHEYKVAGMSPLQWAVHMSETEEFGEDPNSEYERPEDLIYHLRRLTYVGTRTTEITAGLPPSMEGYDETGADSGEEEN